MLQLTARMPLLRSLVLQPFALLWAGQSVSRLGDYLYQVVLAWWVLKTTGSAAAMATVFILTLGPTRLFLLLGGVAVDRYPRARLMLASDIARGLLVVGMAALAFADNLHIEQVYLVCLLFGLLDAFFNPAYSALVPALVPPADLPSANSLTSLSEQLARIVGPAVGALLMAVSGPEWAILANGLTFFVSAIFLLPLVQSERRPARQNETQDGWQQVVADLRLGLREVAGRRWLWVNILLLAVINVTLSGPFVIALPFLVNESTDQGIQRLGLLYAAFAGGYAIAGLLLGQRERIGKRGPIVFIGTGVAGLMLALFGFPLPLWMLLGAAVINGFALEMAGLAWMSSVQEMVAPERMGRVSSLEEIGSIGLIPIGFAAAAWTTTQFGPGTTFLIGGLVTALLAFGLFGLLPSLRQMD